MLVGLFENNIKITIKVIILNSIISRKRTYKTKIKTQKQTFKDNLMNFIHNISIKGKFESDLYRKIQSVYKQIMKTQ